MFSPISKNILKYSFVSQHKCNISYFRLLLQKSHVHNKSLTAALFNNKTNCTRSLHNAATEIATVDNDLEIVNVKIKNNISQYPFVWLRDNCRCAQCYNMTTQARIIQWKDFDLNAKPASINFSSKTNNVDIEWKDGHKSKYSVEWLQERSFNEADRQKYTDNFYKPKKVFWNKNEFDSLFQRFKYKSVMSDDNALYDWLKALSTCGVTLLTNVPMEKDSCRLLSERIGFRKKTHYGEEFTVNAKPGATNYAYTSNRLQLHIDVPGYLHKPGVNLLHCYSQAKYKGGENLLSDGLYVANYLKLHEPAHYKLLSTVLVDWQNIGNESGEDFYCLHRAPVVAENAEGEITEITYSVTQRSSYLNLSVDEVKAWYASLKRFVDLLYENTVEFKVASGELLSFDNTRLVHGRTEYQDYSDQARYIIGAYMDWDIIHSKMRVIYNKR